jgi:hypothetical protein
VQNVLLLLAVLGFGSSVRAVYPKEQSRVDGAALTLLGGLGVLGMLVFCVGQYWFTRISIVLVLSVGILLSLPPFLEFVRHWRLWLADLRAPILPLAIVLVVLLVTAIGGKVIVESTTLWASLKVPQGWPFDVQPEPH